MSISSLRTREPEVQQWNEALPAGEHLGVVAVLSEQRERLVDAAGAVVGERRRLHPLVATIAERMRSGVMRHIGQ